MTALPTSAPIVTTAIALRDVRFSYDGGPLVLDGLTASLEPGRVCVLIGPNAAGKSTLLKLLLGQLTPTSGSVTVCGAAPSSLPPAQRAALVSYVPQRAGASFAFMVDEVVAMGRYALPKDDAAVERAIETCDLTDVRGRVYGQLSVGQQQRVLLARAMAQAAGGGRVMLLDEPGSAMDLWHSHDTMRRLATLAQRGMAVLVVLHDLNLAARYADEAWLLDGGRLVAAGPWASVLRPEVLGPVYRVGLRALGAEAGRPVFAVD